MIVHFYIKHKIWTNLSKCSSDVFQTKSRGHFAGWVCTAQAAEVCASHKMLLTNTRIKTYTKTVKAPRHYLWLRKFLRCKLGENWKDTVRKHYPCFDYTLIYSFSSMSQALLGQWVLSWMEQSLTAVPVLMVVVFLADLSHGWSLTEAQCLIKCVWRLFCSPWTSANSNFSQWLISRG